jgi:acetyl esterase/lipase
MLAKEFMKSRFILSLGLLFASAFLLAACQATRSDLPKGMTEVMATWFQATHSLPPSNVKIDPSKKADLLYMAARISFSPNFKDPFWLKKVGARLKNPESKLPAVMYLHGCGGISGDSDYYGELLTSEGYVVFMPDSFQRSREFCGDEGPLSHRVTLRHEEIKYALSRIQKIPWIDQNRVILMGHSEGGNATDNWAWGGDSPPILSAAALAPWLMECRRHPRAFPFWPSLEKRTNTGPA